MICFNRTCRINDEDDEGEDEVELDDEDDPE